MTLENMSNPFKQYDPVICINADAYPELTKGKVYVINQSDEVGVTLYNAERFIPA
jgi:hypothetical protein